MSRSESKHLLMGSGTQEGACFCWPGSSVSPAGCLPQASPLPPSPFGFVTYPLLQMRELRPRKGQREAQAHGGTGWGSQWRSAAQSSSRPLGDVLSTASCRASPGGITWASGRPHAQSKMGTPGRGTIPGVQAMFLSPHSGWAPSKLLTRSPAFKPPSIF